MVSVGFIGVGGIASRHRRTLAAMPERARLAAFCDLDVAKAEAAVAEHGGAAYADFHEMLAREPLDVVLICTPPRVRSEPIAAAAARGLAIFCEKPPAFDPRDGQQALNAVLLGGVISSVGFMYRRAAVVQRMRALLAGRTLVGVRSAFLNGPCVQMALPGWFYQREHSGGPLMDQAIHILDLHRYLLGDCERVSAFGGSRLHPRTAAYDIEETIALALDFGAGLVSSHVHSWACDATVVELEAFTDTARLRADLVANRLTGVVERQPIDEAPGDDYYVTEIEELLTAVETGDASGIRCCYRDGLDTVAIAWAAQHSIDFGEATAPRRFQPGRPSGDAAAAEIAQEIASPPRKGPLPRSRQCARASLFWF